MQVAEQSTRLPCIRKTRKARILRKKQSLPGAKAPERQKKIMFLIFHVVLM